ncbi:MAG: hypothetical protein KW802_03015 [Candidatus Doudnabacteria bacterium]|nr:hypothetical protein [Candidatus Doudnabacteria bacterium]
MQKIKFYLILLVVLLLSAIIALVYILNTFKPDSLGKISLFYSLIALAGFAAATEIGILLRLAVGQREFLNAYVTQASRQGYSVWL